MVGNASIVGSWYRLDLIEGHLANAEFTDAQQSDNDRAFVRNLCELEKCVPQPFEHPQIACPLHAWIARAPIWPRGPPSGLELVSQQMKATYRTIILGRGIERGHPYRSRWINHLDRLGLEFHYGVGNQTQEVWQNLLRMMYRYYRRTCAPATPVLTTLGFPVTFYGDSRSISVDSVE